MLSRKYLCCQGWSYCRSIIFESFVRYWYVWHHVIKSLVSIKKNLKLQFGYKKIYQGNPDVLSSNTTVKIPHQASLFSDKRKRSTNLKYFSYPWRSDNFSSHLKHQHPIKWKEYECLSAEDKPNFFMKNRKEVWRLASLQNKNSSS